MIMKCNILRSLAVTAIIALLAGSALAEKTTRYTTGYDYTSGDYGQSVTTEIEIISFMVNYIDGPWSLNLSVPYIRVTGNGTIIPGTSGSTFDFSREIFRNRISDATSTQTIVTSGLGDISTSVGYAFFLGKKFFEVTAKVKLGTADESKALGTGKNDYFLQFDGIIGNGGVSPFFTLGYVVTGDSSNATYEDVPYGSFGFMFKMGAQRSSGISYDYWQSRIQGGVDKQQLSAYISWKNTTKLYTSLSGLIGLSDSSPDFGLSLFVSRRY